MKHLTEQFLSLFFCYSESRREGIPRRHLRILRIRAGDGRVVEWGRHRGDRHRSHHLAGLDVCRHLLGPSVSTERYQRESGEWQFSELHSLLVTKTCTSKRPKPNPRLDIYCIRPFVKTKNKTDILYIFHKTICQDHEQDRDSVYCIRPVIKTMNKTEIHIAVYCIRQFVKTKNRTEIQYIA